MNTAKTVTQFIRYLLTKDDLIGLAERPSLERLLADAPSNYTGLWETGLLSGELLADAIAVSQAGSRRIQPRRISSGTDRRSVGPVPARRA
ncbi:hypothetical protein BC360_29430 [Ensifer sp. LC163]|nr:hypothetical protein BC360_29430 [Ensifer sp. LC163]